MKLFLTRISVPLCGAAMVLLVAGCASSGVKNPSGVSVTHMNADEHGFVAGTGVESQDLVMVADKMSRSILAIPQIASAATPPTIVLNPVDNQTRFPINKDIFLTRIRAQLNSKAMGKVMFLARNQMASAGAGAEPEAPGRRHCERRSRGPGIQGRGLFPDRFAARAVHSHHSGHERLHPLRFPSH
jgi:hypothetical protein